MENLISSPLRKRIRSPGFNPALSAGLPAETWWYLMDAPNRHLWVYLLARIKRVIWFTRDDRVDPHWGMTSQSEAKTHVAFAHPHCSVETNTRLWVSQKLHHKTYLQYIRFEAPIWGSKKKKESMSCIHVHGALQSYAAKNKNRRLCFCSVY